MFEFRRRRRLTRVKGGGGSSEGISYCSEKFLHPSNVTDETHVQTHPEVGLELLMGGGQ